MYPTSDAFKAAILAGNQLTTVHVTVTLDGEVQATLNVLSGSVGYDGRREGPLRTLSLSVAPGDGLWNLLNTPGIEFVVSRGLMIAGIEEAVPLGTFVLDSDLSQTDDEAITINAADRSRRISRARWTDPYAIAAGTDVGTAIGAMLTDRWPDCPLGFSTLGATTGAKIAYVPGADSDPWKDAKALAFAHGFELCFDRNGYADILTVPDPETAPADVTYHDGELDVILSETRTSLISQVYSGAIARGEGSEIAVPVQGEAWDDDPYSPTYYLGAFGKVPIFYDSPLLTTQASVDSAAATLLAKKKGRAEQLSWDLIVNPAHDAFDVVDFVADGATRRFMFDEGTIPLTANESMKATARKTRVV